MQIHSKCAENKMTPGNLGIVFGPCVIGTTQTDANNPLSTLAVMDDCQKGKNVIEYNIQNFIDHPELRTMFYENKQKKSQEEEGQRSSLLLRYKHDSKIGMILSKRKHERSQSFIISPVQDERAANFRQEVGNGNHPTAGGEGSIPTKPGPTPSTLQINPLQRHSSPKTPSTLVSMKSELPSVPLKSPRSSVPNNASMANARYAAPPTLNSNAAKSTKNVNKSLPEVPKRDKMNPHAIDLPKIKIPPRQQQPVLENGNDPTTPNKSKLKFTDNIMKILPEGMRSPRATTMIISNPSELKLQPAPPEIELYLKSPADKSSDLSLRKTNGSLAHSEPLQASAPLKQEQKATTPGFLPKPNPFKPTAAQERDLSKAEFQGISPAPAPSSSSSGSDLLHSNARGMAPSAGKPPPPQLPAKPPAHELAFLKKGSSWDENGVSQDHPAASQVDASTVPRLHQKPVENQSQEVPRPHPPPPLRKPTAAPVLENHNYRSNHTLDQNDTLKQPGCRITSMLHDHNAQPLSPRSQSVLRSTMAPETIAGMKMTSPLQPSTPTTSLPKLNQPFQLAPPPVRPRSASTNTQPEAINPPILNSAAPPASPRHRDLKSNSGDLKRINGLNKTTEGTKMVVIDADTPPVRPRSASTNTQPNQVAHPEFRNLGSYQASDPTKASERIHVEKPNHSGSDIYFKSQPKAKTKKLKFSSLLKSKDKEEKKTVPVVAATKGRSASTAVPEDASTSPSPSKSHKLFSRFREKEKSKITISEPIFIPPESRDSPADIYRPPAPGYVRPPPEIISSRQQPAGPQEPPQRITVTASNADATIQPAPPPKTKDVSPQMEFPAFIPTEGKGVVLQREIQERYTQAQKPLPPKPLPKPPPNRSAVLNASRPPLPAPSNVKPPTPAPLTANVKPPKPLPKPPTMLHKIQNNISKDDVFSVVVEKPSVLRPAMPPKRKLRRSDSELELARPTTPS